MKSMLRLSVLSISVLALSLSFPMLACAQQHDDHDDQEEGHHEGGHDSEAAIPDTPEGIVGELLSRVVIIEDYIETGQLTKIHEPAFEAKALVDALAENPGSVGKVQEKAIGAAAKRIGSAAKLLDKYGDSEDVSKTKSAFKTFDVGVQTIKEIFPKAVPSHYWTCSMHPAVWKGGEDKCPKCNMNLIEEGHADHSHGDENKGHDDEHGDHDDDH